MAKRKYREKGQRTRIEYPLTKMGTGLGLPFVAMTEWGDKMDRRWRVALHAPLDGKWSENSSCAGRRVPWSARQAI